MAWRMEFVRKGRILPESLMYIEPTDPPQRSSLKNPAQYSAPETPEVWYRINNNVFGGKLNFVDEGTFPLRARKRHRETSRQPSRVLPFINLNDLSSAEKGGEISQIRMTVHGGTRLPRGLLEEHFLKGRTYLNFWGIPHTVPGYGERLEIIHYGTAYVKDSDVPLVEQHLQNMARMFAQQANHVRV